MDKASFLFDTAICGCTSSVQEHTIPMSPSLFDRTNSIVWKQDSFAEAERRRYIVEDDDESDVFLNDLRDDAFVVDDSFDIERAMSEARYAPSPPRKHAAADDATCTTVASDSSDTFQTHSSIHHDDTFLYDIDLHRMTKPMMRHWSDTGSRDPALEAIAKLQEEGRIILPRLKVPRYEI